MTLANVSTSRSVNVRFCVYAAPSRDDDAHREETRRENRDVGVHARDGAVIRASMTTRGVTQCGVGVRMRELARRRINSIQFDGSRTRARAVAGADAV